MEKWKKLASQLVLTSKERSVFLDWKKQQNSFNTYQLFLVFKAHGYAKDASELLSWALVFEPREREILVLCAHEFFDLGFIKEAWDSLQSDHSRSHSDIRSLNLIFLCSLLLAKSTELHSTMELLEKHKSFDPLSLKIYSTYKLLGTEAAFHLLMQKFHDRRILPILTAQKKSGKIPSLNTQNPQMKKTENFLNLLMSLRRYLFVYE